MSVVPLARADFPAAVDLLAEAFADDAGMLAIIGGARPEALRRWFALTLDLLARTPGAVLGIRRGGRLAGVMVLGGVGTGGQMGWLIRALTGLGWGIAARTIAHDRGRRKTMGGVAARIVEFVAVDRAMRGQGLGAALFGAAHAGGGRFWLETTRAENRAIFARIGYRESQRRSEHGVTYYAMERPDER